MPETLDEIKKYVGPFSGPQMDQIFYEILNYTSERFAKGTAGGVPVAAGTPGYNDNSLFYKNQAAAQVSLAQAAAAAAANSAQRAESAVPAGTDAAILWTRDQSTELTADDKAVARKNIMAGGSNRNLLDNPWFTVNQRSASGTISSVAYFADRWMVFGGSAMAGTYPTINASSNIGQRVAFDIEAGKTYTFSVLLADGTIVSGTKTVTNPNTTISFISNSLVELDYFGGQSPKNIRIYNTSGAALGVKAAKLELGSVSTLANDIAPNYAEELAKCQRYCYVIAASEAWTPICMAYFNNANGKFSARLPLPVPMRAKPSISITGTFRVVITTGSTYQQLQAASITGAGAVRMNGAEIRFDGTIAGGTTGNIGEVNAEDANTKIILSADL